MSNFNFFQKYSRLQEGIMFDRIEKLNFGFLNYNFEDKSGYWNNVVVDKVIDIEDLNQIETLMTKIERLPAVYFEKVDNLLPNVTFLQDRGYQVVGEDCWMFYQGNVLNSSFENVKKVETEDGLELFLNTFDNCYQENDPQNPYGKLGEYLTVAKKSWIKDKGTNRLNYYIVFRDNQPVAVSTLTNFESLGYISNVGSLRKVRGLGFGKIATLHCVRESIKAGNTQTCLATEEGNYPNEFYQRIGFETKFRGLCFQKKP